MKISNNTYNIRTQYGILKFQYHTYELQRHAVKVVSTNGCSEKLQGDLIIEKTMLLFASVSLDATARAVDVSKKTLSAPATATMVLIATIKVNMQL